MKSEIEKEYQRLWDEVKMEESVEAIKALREHIAKVSAALDYGEAHPELFGEGGTYNDRADLKEAEKSIRILEYCLQLDCL